MFKIFIVVIIKRASKRQVHSVTHVELHAFNVQVIQNKINTEQQSPVYLWYMYNKQFYAWRMKHNNTTTPVGTRQVRLVTN